MGLNFQELRFSHGGMAWSAGLLQRSWKFIRWSYGFLRNWEFFKWGVWGFFIMVEAILGWLKLLRGVMFFRFLVGWHFSRSLRFLMGLRYCQWLEFLVRMFEIFQVVAGGLTFFLEVIQFFFGGGGGGYILKLAFSHDEVLSCILQNALNCSLK